MVVFCYFLVFQFYLVYGAPFDDVLRSQSPFFGLAEIAAKNPEIKVSSSSCAGQLKNLYHAVRKHEAWGLKMLDASGSPGNGFIWGNNYWLGSYSQCQWISSKQPIRSFTHVSTNFPPFGVDFYVGSFHHDSHLQRQLNIGKEDLILLGLCLPSSCTAEDLQPLMKTWGKTNALAVQNLYNFTMDLEGVRLIKGNSSWWMTPFNIILIMLLASAVMLTVSGTIYEIYVWKPYVERETQNDDIPLFNEKDDNLWKANNRNIQERTELLNTDNNLNDCIEFKIDNSLHKSIPVSNIKPSETARLEPDQPTVFGKVLLCFSVIENFRSIVSTTNRNSDIQEIYGFRFLGMSWIIWLHTIFYLKDYADNKTLALKLSEGFSEQLITNSTFAVDTFFFISGLLVAIVFYKSRRGSSKEDDNISIKKKVNEFSFMVLKRFLRLTPVYLAVLGIAVAIIKRSKETSLFHITERADEICEKYWWRNVFFINNLFRSEQMCLTWSWYMSTDMQFFLIGTIILILSTRFWRIAFGTAGALILLSSLITAYVSYSYGYIPTLDQQLKMLDLLYYPPWTRIGPYLVGLATGYFVVHLNGRLTVKRTILVTCWIVGSLCNLWALFGLYRRNLSVISTALYTSLSRTAWGLGLSWITIACSTNNAGIIKSILCFRGWVPFSKLSYTAYLISPIIINLIYSSSEKAIHMDFFPLLTYFFGFLGITYICSFFISLIIEVPTTRLIKWAIGHKNVLNILSQNS